MQQLRNRPGFVAQPAGVDVRIYNNSKQVIPIHINPPGGDFFLNEQQVHLRPSKSVMLPKDHLRWEQISNLSARGILRVIYDSSAKNP